MASTDLLVPHLSKIRVPNARDLIYKDECVFSFDNPETESGLFVSLNSFLGFGRSFVEPYFQKSGNAVFLHIRREKKALPLPEHTGDGPEKKITRLAIGIEGGFDPDVASNKYEYTDHYAIVVLPNFATIPWPNDALPDVVKKSVQGVISAESPNKLAELATLAGTWDGEARVISKFAENLQQLDNGVKIPPTGWKCEKCDLTTNLWLNLTDGSILCGRRFFDGSGGNDHAVEHYRATGFPLAVKLGTITPDGQADVFSYAEDDMVLDPNLTEHLKHFGINAKNLEKTEKSMAELELELNKSGGEWHTMCESSSELRPLDGPGLTGINNLGNTCYINSVVQVIFRMPDFVRRFIESAPEVFNSFPPDPVNDFNVQMAKLGVGLMSGRYSLPAEGDSQPGISPHMFRNLIGKRHPEFSTKRQQDVMEFFMHLVNMIERHSVGRDNPTDCLRFTQEERVVCAASNGVRYTRVDSTALSLPVPLAAAVNADQVRQYEARRHQAEALGQRLDPGAIVRPQIPFLACLEGFLKEELIEQYYSTAVKTLTNAIKTTRLATFPDYLLVQLKKFMLKPDWTPAKLDVEVQMPWEVDLSMLRGHTRRPDEILLPEVVEETPQPTFNQALMSQLMEMGFPPEACKKSLYFTQNQGLEAASNWLMEHIGDSDFADTFIVPGSKTGSSAASEIELSQDAIASLTCLGFTEAQAKAALRRTDGNAERAADFLLSHPDEVLESTAAAQQNAEPNHAPQVRDGSSKYRLVAFISHMGTSSTVGHYVCHILHEGRWVIFNDNKVALSENPPKDLAYLYLYERV